MQGCVSPVTCAICQGFVAAAWKTHTFWGAGPDEGRSYLIVMQAATLSPKPSASVMTLQEKEL